MFDKNINMKWVCYVLQAELKQIIYFIWVGVGSTGRVAVFYLIYHIFLS